MRFPINVTGQKRCPVCKKPAPETQPPTTPRPETATLSLSVHSTAQVAGADVFLGWDSGVSKGSRSRTSLGAVVRAARHEGEHPDGNLVSIAFCSTRCLRRFLNAAVDELERRAAAVEPEVRAARQRSEDQ